MSVFRVFETRNYALQVMTKTEKADEAIKAPIRAFHLSGAERVSQFCLTVPKILWVTL